MVLLIAVLAAGVAFAAPEFKMSAGGGGVFGTYFGGGYETTGKIGGTSVSQNLEMPYTGGGGYGFFDATYAELSMGFFMGKIKMKETMSGGGYSSSSEFSANLTNLFFGLYGKYPFTLSDKLSLFPLLGLEYHICLSATGEDDSEADDPGDFSALWLKAGIGMDFSLTDSIYLRLGVLYGARFTNQFETDMWDYAKSSYDETGDSSAGGQHGLTVRLAVGFKF